MVESLETPIALCRDFIPELLRVVAEGGDEEGGSWNAVDSIELLLDAGAFKDAELLARSVIEMLGDDRRNRLFKAYLEYSLLMQGVSFNKGLARLEALFSEIQAQGFSSSDRSWIALILARALHAGVCARAVPESEIFRARTVLSAEFSKQSEPHPVPTRLKVGLELAKTYIHAPVPELPAARSLLESLLLLCHSGEVKPDIVFDVKRALFHVGVGQTKRSDTECDQLRSLAMPLGGVARGLAELAIGKSGMFSGTHAQECFEKALRLFEESSYRSGEFEAALSLARNAGEAEHHARAYRLFARADVVAEAGGFICGRGAALLGLFHSSLSSNDLEQANQSVIKLQQLAQGDLFCSAFGLNIIAVYQLMGMHKEAVHLATRCEKGFAAKGMCALAGQASYMLGASHAETGNWRFAQSAWKRSLVCEEVARNVFGACDKRAALAQAVAMTKFTQRGRLEQETRKQVSKLLTMSERTLAPFAGSTLGLESLGRTLQVHAQISILDQNPLEALRHLNRARQCFSELGREREVSVTDGLTGLALLEASKVGGAVLLEEAMMALQRSLDYFASAGEGRVGWKLRYYLAVAATLRAQQSADPLHRENFKVMAKGLLHEATVEAERFSGEWGMPRASSGEGDFAPGLKPEVLRVLKESLGLGETRRERGGDPQEGPAKSNRYRGYLH